MGGCKETDADGVRVDGGVKRAPGKIMEASLPVWWTGVVMPL